MDIIYTGLHPSIMSVHYSTIDIGTFKGLLPHIDSEQELIREKFLPQILSALEPSVELRQILNSFATFSLTDLGHSQRKPSLCIWKTVKVVEI